MNKKPVLLRSLFALIVVAVFVFSMFPLQESDFYDTFESLLADRNDPTIRKVIDLAKQKQNDDKLAYAYPSQALEAAAKEIHVPGANGTGSYPVDLVRYVKPAAVKSQKLQNNADVISLIRKNAAGALRLGIDLNGGAEFLLRLKPDESKVTSTNYDALRDTAIETIRKRLEGQNIFETEISPAGQDYISVRVPIVSEDQKANLEKILLRSARLEFRLVHPMSQQACVAYEAYLEKGGDPDAYLDTPEGAEFLSIEERNKNGDLTVRYELVEIEPQMTGDRIRQSQVGVTRFGQREIQLSFTPEGAAEFGRVTEANVGRRLAIVLDGKLYSAPVLNEPIYGGNAQITGDFSQEEAKNVSDALNSGSLPFSISVVSRSNIDPTVGSETIQKSIVSGIIGTILVMIFMLIYYRSAGMIANISLLVNALVLLGAMAAFDVTLTLPGIAGIVLTLGMAVDANVLIYERIREEQNAGKPLAAAVDVGFNRAFSAIFDSNLTTMFTGIILYWQGTGAIKGFAMTLVIGIFTTLFTAVFLTRILFDLMLRIPGLKMKKINMMMFFPNPNVPFVKLRFVGFAVSAFLIVASLIIVGVKCKNGTAFGIDFTGGTQIMVDYVPLEKGVERIPVSDIDRYLNEQGYDAKSTYKNEQNGEDGKRVLEVVVRPKDKEDVSARQLIADMDAAFPEVKFTMLSESTLGALIGRSFMVSSVKALIFAMIGMIIYLLIRFQFSYSIAANVALLHDVVVATGLYLAMGGQITLQVIASLLTLIGYSVNDTIVIFDRQRENLALHKDMNYFDIVNLSLNQTLARTILTSVSVILVLVSQLVFGGEGIHDFILVMLIGCIVGCYSSIFVSPIITAYWHRKEKGRAA